MRNRFAKVQLLLVLSFMIGSPTSFAKSSSSYDVGTEFLVNKATNSTAVSGAHLTGGATFSNPDMKNDLKGAFGLSDSKPTGLFRFTLDGSYRSPYSTSRTRLPGPAFITEFSATAQRSRAELISPGISIPIERRGLLYVLANPLGIQHNVGQGDILLSHGLRGILQYPLGDGLKLIADCSAAFIWDSSEPKFDEKGNATVVTKTLTKPGYKTDGFGRHLSGQLELDYFLDDFIHLNAGVVVENTHYKGHYYGADKSQIGESETFDRTSITGKVGASFAF